MNIQQEAVNLLREVVRKQGGHAVQITFADTGELNAVIDEKRITDSFKMRIDFKAKTYAVEVTNKADDDNITFLCTSMEAMVTTYLAVACFWRERVKSRFDDI